jgi:hypothetical protein
MCLLTQELIYGTANIQVLEGSSASMEPTIISGNYVLVNKQVNPRDLSVDYPNSDIIVFSKPGDLSQLVVHSIVEVNEIDGSARAPKEASSET